MASAGVPPLRTGDWSRIPTRMGLVDPLRLALPLPVAQDELLDLAGRGLGQLAEVDRGGRLEARDVPLAEVDDLCLARALAPLEGDEGPGPLAPFFITDGHYFALHHRGVPGHALLDLDGRDVLAARDDDVLLAVAQLDVAVGMPDPDVARVEPAAPAGLRGRVPLLVIALAHVVADHHHLAEGLPVARHVVHLAVHHPHEVEERVALALARGQARLLLGGQAVPVRVPRADGVGPP